MIYCLLYERKACVTNFSYRKERACTRLSKPKENTTANNKRKMKYPKSIHVSYVNFIKIGFIQNNSINANKLQGILNGI